MPKTAPDQKEIWITEQDFEVIQRALQQLAKRLIANAQNTKNGYGTAKSQEKFDNFLKQAKQCQDLESELAERFI